MNWNIDIKSLIDYKTPTWNDDSFIETIDTKYGICLYNIAEERMGTYFCNMAVYKDKDNPILIINSAQRYWYAITTPFDYIPAFDCLILKTIVYNPVTKCRDLPFIVLRLVEQKFGFIEFDDTSIYYGISKGNNDSISLIETHSKALEKHDNKRSGEEFLLNDILWFDFIHLDKMNELYNKIIK